MSWRPAPSTTDRRRMLRCIAETACATMAGIGPSSGWLSMKRVPSRPRRPQHRHPEHDGIPHSGAGRQCDRGGGSRRCGTGAGGRHPVLGRPARCCHAQRRDGLVVLAFGQAWALWWSRCGDPSADRPTTACASQEEIRVFEGVLMRRVRSPRRIPTLVRAGWLPVVRSFREALACGGRVGFCAC